VKADVKSEKFRRMRYLALWPVFVPSKFLWSCITVIWAFCLKPYPLALKEFGIRMVSFENDGTWDNHTEVYAALEMLNWHDRERLELVKKHIRIIFLAPKINTGCFYSGTGVCLLNLRRIPVELSTRHRALTIISWLVYEASRAKFAGKFGAYLRTSEAIKNLCKEESQRTMQKFRE
jgi:hypothetical protein